MALILTDLQQVTLSVSAQDALGNAAKVDGKPVWAVNDPNQVIVLTVSDDGSSATAVTTGKVGTAQIQVTADADLGSGVTQLTAVQDVEVVASAAVTLGIAHAEPSDRPASADTAPSA